MITRTADFDEAVKYGHTVISKALVYPASGDPVELAVEDGYVRVQDQPVRRRASVKLLDDGELVPEGFGDLLSPTSSLKLFRGIRLLDGTDEFLPVFTGSISDVKIDDDGESVILNIDAYDYGRKVMRARMTTDYPIASGTNIKTALAALLASRYPAIAFSAEWDAFAVSDTFSATSLLVGDDPWVFTRKVGREALAADIFFDTNGELSIKPISDPSTAPVDWTYAEGDEAMLLSVSKRFNDDSTVNHMVVTGTHPDLTVPVRGEAKDDNPASPTYYLGPIGDVVQFLESTFISTQAQADAAALANLNKELGEQEAVRFVSIPHPAHDVDDIVQITREKVKINAVYVVDDFTLPLSESSPMNMQTRQRRV